MKINKKKSVVEFVFITGVLVVMLGSLVSAFGYSHIYDNEKNPLNVYSGQKINVQINIKSSPSEGDLIIEVELTDEAGIAKIIDSSTKYSVSPGIAGDGIINLELKIPKSATIGDKYFLSLRLKDVTGGGGEGGMVSFSQSSNLNLNVFVVEKPEGIKDEGNNTIWYLIFGIIVIVAIIISFVMKKKSSVPAKKPTVPVKK